MKVARLVGLALIAIFAVSAMSASIAAGADPEFKDLPLQPKFTSTSGESILKGSKNTVICASDETNGEVTSMDTVGKVLVIYHKCTISTATGTCTYKSITGKEGEIVTNPIVGLLGLVASASEATSKIGLLFEPESGNSKFVSFAAVTGPCGTIPVATANGTVAGELTPGAPALQNTLKIILQESVTEPHTNRIKKITVLTGEKKTLLETFGEETSNISTDLVTFDGKVQVG